MRDRLLLIRELLSEDGTLAVHIDDTELGYLIVLLDELFGRSNRISLVTFKQSSVSGPKAQNPGLVTIANYVLLYAKNRAAWRPRRVFVPVPRDKRYNQFIENRDAPCSEWRFVTLRSAIASREGCTPTDLRTRFGKDLDRAMEEFVLDHPDCVARLARVQPKDVSAEARQALAASLELRGSVQRFERSGRPDYYFLDGQQVLFYSAKAQQIDGRWVTGLPASNLWEDLLSNNLHNEGGVRFPKGKKPEALIQRILELATDPGDYVLDSFAGSGTTGAVAHKMRRAWIMVELGEHCITHVLPRMTSVIDGTDSSGITRATQWEGGGGFRFYHLAPSLLEKDQWGNWIVSKSYNAAMLAEAMCKLEGFRYEPDPVTFWMHGRSTETDFLYVTTQNLSRAQLQFISEQVGSQRTLLICCGAFRGKRDEFANLTLKKIPQAVLHRCEWGKDDYSLNVQALPQTESEAEEHQPSKVPPKPTAARRSRRSGKKSPPSMQQLPLFDAKKKGKNKP